jgi:FkbM family methyltransferase
MPKAISQLSQGGRPPLGFTVKRLRDSVRNWYLLGPLLWMVLPTRMPPRQGMAGTWLGRRPATFRMRSGSTVRCRLQDAEGPFAVYVQNEYELAWLDWPSLRTVVDVGAHVGAFTVWAAERCPKARMLAIEPNPAVFQHLVENVAANGLHDRVQTRQVALGDHVGEAFLDVREFSEWTRVLPTADGRGHPVHLTTLEQVLDAAHFDRVDFLKMDCEGSEYDILLTAPDRVLGRIQALICEYHPGLAHDDGELRSRLRAHGFVVGGDTTPQGLLWARRS